ncbi:MAG: disulfide bond formation protein B [Betaproteobacteria bacterium]
MSRSISIITRWNTRSTVLSMSLVAFSIGLAAIILASTLKLDACHLCIFQRLVYFVIGAVLLISSLVWNFLFLRIATLAITAGFSVWGLFVAAQQSWLQWFPDSGLSCNIVEPGATERLIDWLGQLYPLLFMATGFCGSKDLVIVGLSLANWSFLVLSIFFLVSSGLALTAKSHSQRELVDISGTHERCEVDRQNLSESRRRYD